LDGRILHRVVQLLVGLADRVGVVAGGGGLVLCGAVMALTWRRYCGTCREYTELEELRLWQAARCPKCKRAWLFSDDDGWSETDFDLDNLGQLL
jgi:hypothetical protein